MIYLFYYNSYGIDVFKCMFIIIEVENYKKKLKKIFFLLLKNIIIFLEYSLNFHIFYLIFPLKNVAKGEI